MKWFKFYGQDYLSDPKMLALNACQRSCWITLLSYGSVNDDGVISFLDEDQLMAQAGISPTHDDWDYTKGVLKKLEKLKMITIDDDKITICNWDKRQDSFLTDAERSKKYRDKAKSHEQRDDRHTGVTLDKIRVDKSREDKKREEEKPENSLSFLENLPEEFTNTLLDKYNTTPKGIKDLGETLANYCRSKGKKYSNYKAFYLNAAKRDFTEKNDADRERQRRIEESKMAGPSQFARSLTDKMKMV